MYLPPLYLHLSRCVMLAVSCHSVAHSDSCGRLSNFRFSAFKVESFFAKMLKFVKGNSKPAEQLVHDIARRQRFTQLAYPAENRSENRQEISCYIDKEIRQQRDRSDGSSTQIIDNRDY